MIDVPELVGVRRDGSPIWQIAGGDDWPLWEGGPVDYVGLSATQVQTTVTSNATAHVKGSYAQVIASTSRNAEGFWLTYASSGATPGLLDIAIGAAAAEQVIVPNLLLNYSVSTAPVGEAVYLPIPIPAGSRVAARCQDGAGGRGYRVSLALLGETFGTPQGLQRMTAYGPSTATSQAPLVTASATPGTKGSWVQMVASTTNPIRWIVLVTGANVPSTVNKNIAADIGVGASGSEIVVVKDLWHAMGNTNAFSTPTPRCWSVPVNIAAGSRLAVRIASDTASAAAQYALYGLD